jgi:hypothetical protein
LCKGGEVKPDEMELREDVLLVNTATDQELLDCNHSKAHNFKKRGKEE